MAYFKADVFGDLLLIRTFLFLTNNGTPEAKKLEKLIGIQKEDKKYLGIDKLDTFINSDIKENSKLKEIFTQAGCGSLFKMTNLMTNKPDQIQSIALNISKYLGLAVETEIY